MAPVSLFHEAPLEVIRLEPRVVLDLLGWVGRAPKPEAELSSALLDSELTEAAPLVRNADAVVALSDGAGRIVSIVVVEIQRERDDDKLRSWPFYLAYLISRYQVPARLLVLTFDAAVARWASTSRRHGSLTVRPTVIGPRNFPRIGSVAEAAGLGPAAVIAALARLAGPGGPGARETEVLRVFEAVMQAPASEARRTYLSLLHGTAKSPLRARLEAILEEHGMGALEIIYNDGKAEGVALGKAEGVAIGKAEGVAIGEALALLTVLRRRRVSLSAEAEARIRSTTDVAQLERWLERAVEARDEADIFVGD